MAVGVDAHRSLHVEACGTGEPVLLLHSSGLSGRQWRRLAAAIADRGLRAVVPDLSGHGLSPAWEEPRPFSFRQDVSRIVELASAEGPAHVVGHSYGAWIALEAALVAPRSIRSLALYDPTAASILDPTADREVRAALVATGRSWGPLESDRERWLSAFVDYWAGPGAWTGLREDVRAEYRRTGWVVYEGVRTSIEGGASIGALARLEMPVLLVTGERSPAGARRGVERLAACLPTARTVVIAGAGHLGPLTHAGEVDAHFLAALPHEPEEVRSDDV